MIRLPLGVPVSGRHNTHNIHIGGPHILSKDAYGSGEHNETQLLEGITRKIYILEGHTSFQKMRMDQANTMRPERSLSDAAFLRHGFH